jgi:hypothetical protein
MRIGVFLMSVAVLATQLAPGRAAADDTTLKPPAKLKLPPNLRGAMAPETTPTPAPRPPPILTPLSSAATPRPAGFSLIPAATDAKPEEGQCRMACAHAYYFCPDAPGSTDCAATWSQCLTDCSHPPISIDR